MLIVVMLRQPPCKTTLGNVKRYGSGAVNIDACRILGNVEEMEGRSGVGREQNRIYSPGIRNPSDSICTLSSKGRWPANLIFPSETATALDEYAGERRTSYSDATKARLKSLERKPSRGRHTVYGRGLDTKPVGTLYADYGGPSRYFFRVGGDMESLPNELFEYLRTLISPPASFNPNVVVVREVGNFDWGALEPQTLHGMIVVGDPTAHKEDIDRALRPGGHLLVIGKDTDAWQASAICELDDHGYEVRDAICIPEHQRELHYLPKPTARERNAGVEPRRQGVLEERLFPFTEGDALELREELQEVVPRKMLRRMEERGLPLDAVPEEMLDRFEQRRVSSVRFVRNHHPTVKSVALMRKLLEDVPDGGIVCDPFMGSGTTGIACIQSGHTFIGIEHEAEYLQIAEERIRDANAGRVRGMVEIVSDLPGKEASPPLTIEQLLDL